MRSADAALWFSSYITGLMQRDVRQLAEIEKISALPNIMNVLAARAGGLLNDADCARDAKLKEQQENQQPGKRSDRVVE